MTQPDAAVGPTTADHGAHAPGKPSRGTYAVGRARREEILDVALASFAEVGYSVTSMAKIAQDVGLTGPGLTHYFPTKQHLLVAVAERRLDALRASADDEPEDTDGTGPLRQMVRLTTLDAANPSVMAISVLVAAEAADPTTPAHSLYVARYDAVVADLTGRFQRSVAAGFLRADVDYESIARECIALADGLHLQWVMANGRIDVVALVTAHLERLAPNILVSGARVDLSRPLRAASRRLGVTLAPPASVTDPMCTPPAAGLSNSASEIVDNPVNKS